MTAASAIFEMALTFFGCGYSIFHQRGLGTMIQVFGKLDYTIKVLSMFAQM